MLHTHSRRCVGPSDMLSIINCFVCIVLTQHCTFTMKTPSSCCVGEQLDEEGLSMTTFFTHLINISTDSFLYYFNTFYFCLFVFTLICIDACCLQVESR